MTGGRVGSRGIPRAPARRAAPGTVVAGPTVSPRTVAAGLVAAVLALTGCASSSSSGGLTPLGEAGSTPTSTASAETSGAVASGSATAGARPSGSTAGDTLVVRVGRVDAPSAQARAAAEVWVRYWRVRAGASHDATVDEAALAAVATGPAADEVTARVGTLRARGHHTVGEFTVSVTKVALTDSTATVTSCLRNRSYDVDRRSHPVELPVAAYRLTGSLTRSGGTWRVSELTVTRRGTC